MRALVFLLAALLATACNRTAGGQVSCEALRSPQYARELDVFAPSQPGVAIPRTVDEALASLDRTLTPVQKAQVRCASDATDLHFSLGRWVRNEWGLYDKSPLALDLIAKGFITPDDMSEAIVDSYARRLKGGAPDLAALAARDRAFWTARGVDVDAEMRRLTQGGG